MNVLGQGTSLVSLAYTREIETLIWPVHFAVNFFGVEILLGMLVVSHPKMSAFSDRIKVVWSSPRSTLNVLRALF